MGKALKVNRGGGGKALVECFGGYSWDPLLGSNNIPAPAVSGTLNGNTVSAPTTDYSKLYIAETPLNLALGMSAFQTGVLSSAVIVNKGESKSVVLRNLGGPSTGGYANLGIHVNADGSFYEYIEYSFSASSSNTTLKRYDLISILTATYI